MVPTNLQQNSLLPKSPERGSGKGGSSYRTSLLPKSPEWGLGNIGSSNHLPPKPFNSEAWEACNKSSSPGVLLQQLVNRSVPTSSNQENLAAAHSLQTPQLIASPSRDLRWNPVTTPAQALQLISLDSCVLPQKPSTEISLLPTSPEWGLISSGPSTSPRAPSTSQVQTPHTTASASTQHIEHHDFPRGPLEIAFTYFARART